jgi:phage gpG-like protein
MGLMRIDVQGQPRIDAVLSAIDSALDVTSILDESAAILLNRIRTNFLAETSPDGVKWVRSEAAKEREEKGRGGGTLFDTGRLYQSIQLFAGGGNTRSIGTDVPYAKFHNNGQGQEQREFLGFGESDVNLVQLLIIKRITEALHGVTN